MGVESSAEIPRVLQEITNWPKTRVESVIKSYGEGEYDFGIDYQVVMNITGYEPEEAKELVRVHSKNDSGIVNAITLLITIISLGNSENRNEVGRLESIFDLMDFSHNSQISMDEMTILLLCVGASFSFTLGLNADEETSKDPVIIEFSKAIYESMGKKHSSYVTKEELCEWVKENVFIQGATNVNDILARLTQTVENNSEKAETA